MGEREKNSILKERGVDIAHTRMSVWWTVCVQRALYNIADQEE